MDSRSLKPLAWVGSAYADLSALPREVQHVTGQALEEAQRGNKHPDAKPLKGFGGAGVLEIVADFGGNAYRAVYTVKFPSSVYVLHVFQKKSHSGISTPKHEIDRVHARLAEARRLHDARWRVREVARAPYGPETETRRHPHMGMITRKDPVEHTIGSDNVFADLMLPDPEELMLKSRLVSAIRRILEERGLAGAEAARVLAMAEPEVADLVRGRLELFSVNRLLCFVKALGHEVEVVVRPGQAEPAEVYAARA